MLTSQTETKNGKLVRKFLCLYLAAAMALTQAMPYGWAQWDPNNPSGYGGEGDGNQPGADPNQEPPEGEQPSAGGGDSTDWMMGGGDGTLQPSGGDDTYSPGVQATPPPLEIFEGYGEKVVIDAVEEDGSISGHTANVVDGEDVMAAVFYETVNSETGKPDYLTLVEVDQDGNMGEMLLADMTGVTQWGEDGSVMAGEIVMERFDEYGERIQMMVADYAYDEVRGVSVQTALNVIDYTDGKEFRTEYLWSQVELREDQSMRRGELISEKYEVLRDPVTNEVVGEMRLEKLVYKYQDGMQLEAHKIVYGPDGMTETSYTAYSWSMVELAADGTLTDGILTAEEYVDSSRSRKTKGMTWEYQDGAEVSATEVLFNEDGSISEPVPTDEVALGNPLNNVVKRVSAVRDLVGKAKPARGFETRQRILQFVENLAAQGIDDENLDLNSDGSLTEADVDMLAGIMELPQAAFEDVFAQVLGSMNLKKNDWNRDGIVNFDDYRLLYDTLSEGHRVPGIPVLEALVKPLGLSVMDIGKVVMAQDAVTGKWGAQVQIRGVLAPNLVNDSAQLISLLETPVPMANRTLNVQLEEVLMGAPCEVGPGGNLINCPPAVYNLSGASLQAGNYLYEMDYRIPGEIRPEIQSDNRLHKVLVIENFGYVCDPASEVCFAMEPVVWQEIGFDYTEEATSGTFTASIVTSPMKQGGIMTKLVLGAVASRPVAILSVLEDQAQSGGVVRVGAYHFDYNEAGSLKMIKREKNGVPVTFVSGFDVAMTDIYPAQYVATLTEAGTIEPRTEIVRFENWSELFDRAIRFENYETRVRSAVVGSLVTFFGYGGEEIQAWLASGDLRIEVSKNSAAVDAIFSESLKGQVRKGSKVDPLGQWVTPEKIAFTFQEGTKKVGVLPYGFQPEPIVLLKTAVAEYDSMGVVLEGIDFDRARYPRFRINVDFEHIAHHERSAVRMFAVNPNPDFVCIQAPCEETKLVKQIFNDRFNPCSGDMCLQSMPWESSDILYVAAVSKVVRRTVSYNLWQSEELPRGAIHVVNEFGSFVPELLGRANIDGLGVIDWADVAELERILKLYQETGDVSLVAGGDVSGDGSLNDLDLTTLQQIVAGRHADGGYFRFLGDSIFKDQMRNYVSDVTANTIAIEGVVYSILRLDSGLLQLQGVEDPNLVITSASDGSIAIAGMTGRVSFWTYDGSVEIALATDHVQIDRRNADQAALSTTLVHGNHAAVQLPAGYTEEFAFGTVEELLERIRQIENTPHFIPFMLELSMNTDGAKNLTIDVKADFSAAVRMHDRQFTGVYDPATGVITTAVNPTTGEKLTLQITEADGTKRLETLKIETPEYFYDYTFTGFGMPAGFDLWRGGTISRKDRFQYVNVNGQYKLEHSTYDTFGGTTDPSFRSWTDSHWAYDSQGNKFRVVNVEGSIRDGALLYSMGGYTTFQPMGSVRDVKGVKREWIKSAQDFSVINAMKEFDDNADGALTREEALANLLLFKATFAKRAGDPGYDARFDFDKNNQVDKVDLHAVKVILDGVLTPEELDDLLPNPERDAAVQAAVAQLAAELGVQDPSLITVVSTQATEWNNGCRGWSVPGQMCTMAFEKGYIVVLKLYGHEYEFHDGRLDPAKAVAIVAMKDWMSSGAELSSLRIESSGIISGEEQPVIFEVTLTDGLEKRVYRIDYWDNKRILSVESFVVPFGISAAIHPYSPDLRELRINVQANGQAAVTWGRETAQGVFNPETMSLQMNAPYAYGQRTWTFQFGKTPTAGGTNQYYLISAENLFTQAGGTFVKQTSSFGALNDYDGRIRQFVSDSNMMAGTFQHHTYDYDYQAGSIREALLTAARITATWANDPEGDGVYSETDIYQTNVNNTFWAYGDGDLQTVIVGVISSIYAPDLGQENYFFSSYSVNEGEGQQARLISASAEGVDLRTEITAAGDWAKINPYAHVKNEFYLVRGFNVQYAKNAAGEFVARKVEQGGQTTIVIGQPDVLSQESDDRLFVEWQPVQLGAASYTVTFGEARDGYDYMNQGAYLGYGMTFRDSAAGGVVVADFPGSVTLNGTEYEMTLDEYGVLSLEPVVHVVPFEISASDWPDGPMDDLRISVADNGQATVTWRNNTVHQGMFDLATMSIHMEVPFPYRLEHWDFKFGKMQLEGGGDKYFLLSSEFSFPEVGTKSTRYYGYFSDDDGVLEKIVNGPFSNGRIDTHLYSYQRGAMGQALKTASLFESVSPEGVPIVTVKEFYAYDAEDRAISTVTARVDTESNFFAASYWRRVYEGEEFRVISANAQNVNLIDQISTPEDWTVIDQHALVRDEVYYTHVGDLNDVYRFFVQYAKNTAGEFVARKVYLNNGQMLIVVGQPDVLSQESDDKPFVEWQFVQAGGASYTVTFGEARDGYDYMNQGAYLGYGMTFRDSAAGGVVVADFPGSVTLNGTEYEMTLDEYGVLSLEPVVHVVPFELSVSTDIEGNGVQNMSVTVDAEGNAVVSALGETHTGVYDSATGQIRIGIPPVYSSVASIDWILNVGTNSDNSRVLTSFETVWKFSDGNQQTTNTYLFRPDGLLLNYESRHFSRLDGFVSELRSYSYEYVDIGGQVKPAAVLQSYDWNSREGYHTSNRQKNLYAYDADGNRYLSVNVNHNFDSIGDRYYASYELTDKEAMQKVYSYARGVNLYDAVLSAQNYDLIDAAAQVKTVYYYNSDTNFSWEALRFLVQFSKESNQWKACRVDMPDGTTLIVAGDPDVLRPEGNPGNDPDDIRFINGQEMNVAGKTYHVAYQDGWVANTDEYLGYGMIFTEVNWFDPSWFGPMGDPVAAADFPGNVTLDGKEYEMTIDEQGHLRLNAVVARYTANLFGDGRQFEVKVLEDQTIEVSGPQWGPVRGAIGSKIQKEGLGVLQFFTREDGSLAEFKIYQRQTDGSDLLLNRLYYTETNKLTAEVHRDGMAIVKDFASAVKFSVTYEFDPQEGLEGFQLLLSDPFGPLGAYNKRNMAAQIFGAGVDFDLVPVFGGTDAQWALEQKALAVVYFLSDVSNSYADWPITTGWRLRLGEGSYEEYVTNGMIDIAGLLDLPQSARTVEAIKGTPGQAGMLADDFLFTPGTITVAGREYNYHFNTEHARLILWDVANQELALEATFVFPFGVVDPTTPNPSNPRLSLPRVVINGVEYQTAVLDGELQLQLHVVPFEISVSDWPNGRPSDLRIQVAEDGQATVTWRTQTVQGTYDPATMSIHIDVPNPYGPYQWDFQLGKVALPEGADQHYLITSEYSYPEENGIGSKWTTFYGYFSDSDGLVKMQVSEGPWSPGSKQIHTRTYQYQKGSEGQPLKTAAFLDSVFENDHTDYTREYWAYDGSDRQIKSVYVTAQGSGYSYASYRLTDYDSQENRIKITSANVRDVNLIAEVSSPDHWVKIEEKANLKNEEYFSGVSLPNAEYLFNVQYVRDAALGFIPRKVDISGGATYVVNGNADVLSTGESDDRLIVRGQHVQAGVADYRVDFGEIYTDFDYMMSLEYVGYGLGLMDVATGEWVLIPNFPASHRIALNGIEYDVTLDDQGYLLLDETLESRWKRALLVFFPTPEERDAWLASGVQITEIAATNEVQFMKAGVEMYTVRFGADRHLEIATHVVYDGTPFLNSEERHFDASGNLEQRIVTEVTYDPAAQAQGVYLTTLKVETAYGPEGELVYRVVSDRFVYEEGTGVTLSYRIVRYDLTLDHPSSIFLYKANPELETYWEITGISFSPEGYAETILPPNQEPISISAFAGALSQGLDLNQDTRVDLVDLELAELVYDVVPQVKEFMSPEALSPFDYNSDGRLTPDDLSAVRDAIKAYIAAHTVAATHTIDLGWGQTMPVQVYEDGHYTLTLEYRTYTSDAEGNITLIIYPVGAIKPVLHLDFDASAGYALTGMTLQNWNSITDTMVGPKNTATFIKRGGQSLIGHIEREASSAGLATTVDFNYADGVLTESTVGYTAAGQAVHTTLTKVLGKRNANFVFSFGGEPLIWYYPDYPGSKEFVEVKSVDGVVTEIKEWTWQSPGGTFLFNGVMQIGAPDFTATDLMASARTHDALKGLLSDDKLVRNNQVIAIPSNIDPSFMIDQISVNGVFADKIVIDVRQHPTPTSWTSRGFSTTVTSEGQIRVILALPNLPKREYVVVIDAEGMVTLQDAVEPLRVPEVAWANGEITAALNAMNALEATRAQLMAETEAIISVIQSKLYGAPMMPGYRAILQGRMNDLRDFLDFRYDGISDEDLAQAQTVVDQIAALFDPENSDNLEARAAAYFAALRGNTALTESRQIAVQQAYKTMLEDYIRRIEQAGTLDEFHAIARPEFGAAEASIPGFDPVPVPDNPLTLAAPLIEEAVRLISVMSPVRQVIRTVVGDLNQNFAMDLSTATPARYDQWKNLYVITVTFGDQGKATAKVTLEDSVLNNVPDLLTGEVLRISPLRRLAQYPKVIVYGLDGNHMGNGIICPSGLSCPMWPEYTLETGRFSTASAYGGEVYNMSYSPSSDLQMLGHLPLQNVTISNAVGSIVETLNYRYPMSNGYVDFRGLPGIDIERTGDPFTRRVTIGRPEGILMRGGEVITQVVTTDAANQSLSTDVFEYDSYSINGCVPSRGGFCLPEYGQALNRIVRNGVDGLTEVTEFDRIPTYVAPSLFGAKVTYYGFQVLPVFSTNVQFWNLEQLIGQLDAVKTMWMEAMRAEASMLEADARLRVDQRLAELMPQLADIQSQIVMLRDSEGPSQSVIAAISNLNLQLLDLADGHPAVELRDLVQQAANLLGQASALVEDWPARLAELDMLLSMMQGEIGANQNAQRDMQGLREQIFSSEDPLLMASLLQQLRDMAAGLPVQFPPVVMPPPLDPQAILNALESIRSQMEQVHQEALLRVIMKRYESEEPLLRSLGKLVTFMEAEYLPDGSRNYMLHALDPNEEGQVILTVAHDPCRPSRGGEVQCLAEGVIMQVVLEIVNQPGADVVLDIPLQNGDFPVGPIQIHAGQAFRLMPDGNTYIDGVREITKAQLENIRLASELADALAEGNLNLNRDPVIDAKDVEMAEVGYAAAVAVAKLLTPDVRQALDLDENGSVEFADQVLLTSRINAHILREGLIGMVNGNLAFANREIGLLTADIDQKTAAAQADLALKQSEIQSKRLDLENLAASLGAAMSQLPEDLPLRQEAEAMLAAIGAFVANDLPGLIEAYASGYLANAVAGPTGVRGDYERYRSALEAYLIEVNAPELSYEELIELSERFPRFYRTGLIDLIVLHDPALELDVKKSSAQDLLNTVSDYIGPRELVSASFGTAAKIKVIIAMGVLTVKVVNGAGNVLAEFQAKGPEFYSFNEANGLLTITETNDGKRVVFNTKNQTYTVSANVETVVYPEELLEQNIVYKLIAGEFKLWSEAMKKGDVTLQNLQRRYSQSGVPLMETLSRFSEPYTLSSGKTTQDYVTLTRTYGRGGWNPYGVSSIRRAGRSLAVRSSTIHSVGPTNSSILATIDANISFGYGSSYKSGRVIFDFSNRSSAVNTCPKSWEGSVAICNSFFS